MTEDIQLESFRTLRVTLTDTGSGVGEQEIKIFASPLGITIQPENYGDKTSDIGHGTPIWFELRDGELRLVVWSNINEECPTHVVSLSGAREDQRLPNPEE